MTRKIFAAAAIAALTIPMAAPVIAQNDSPDTVLEIRKKFAEGDTSNEIEVYEGEKAGITPEAAEILSDEAASDDSDNMATTPTAEELLKNDMGEGDVTDPKLLKLDDDGDDSNS